MKYRKKPVVIEAVQWTGNLQVLKPWMNELGALPFYLNNDNEFMVKTLEGDMKVSFNDWIIRGIKNEFYACKPDIFEETYEQA